MQVHFEPRALEQTKVAQRIRAQLGTWPIKNTAIRLCTQGLAPSDNLHPGDWMIIDADATPTSALVARRHQALHEGLIVLEIRCATAEQNSGNPASLCSLEMTLHVPQPSSMGPVKPYVFSGHCTAQWQAALAAFLDCGFAAQDALTLAYAWRDIEPGLLSDHDDRDSWPEHLETFPHLLAQPSVHAAFASCPAHLGLYAIVPNATWVERVLTYGVNTLQLRIKKNGSGQTGSIALGPEDVQEITRAVQAARAHNARLFINDYWEHAIELGAYGVHLGQEDLDTADLNRIAQAGLRLGISTHGYYEMLRAYQIKPSYMALGAVFPTTTKQMPTAPQGLARLARYVRLLEGAIPLVAIGGIDSTVLGSVLATGVGSAAVVRAITEAADPEHAVTQLQNTF